MYLNVQAQYYYGVQYVKIKYAQGKSSLSLYCTLANNHDSFNFAMFAIYHFFAKLNRS